MIILYGIHVSPSWKFLCVAIMRIFICAAILGINSIEWYTRVAIWGIKYYWLLNVLYDLHDLLYSFDQTYFMAYFSHCIFLVLF